jgi:hypothetical protein
VLYIGLARPIWCQVQVPEVPQLWMCWRCMGSCTIPWWPSILHTRSKQSCNTQTSSPSCAQDQGSCTIHQLSHHLVCKLKAAVQYTSWLTILRAHSMHMWCYACHGTESSVTYHLACAWSRLLSKMWSWCHACHQRLTPIVSHRIRHGPSPIKQICIDGHGLLDLNNGTCAQDCSFCLDS